MLTYIESELDRTAPKMAEERDPETGEILHVIEHDADHAALILGLIAFAMIAVGGFAAFTYLMVYAPISTNF